jgi:FkbM family methyltransferase
MAVDHRCLVQRELLYKGTFEEGTLEILKLEIGPDDIFYDVGANVGLHSCVALQAGARQAIMFEPDPSNCSVARLNLRLNGFANFVLLELALDDRDGQRMFFAASPENMGTGGFSRSGPGRCFVVPVETLDHVSTKLELPTPSVLKIDVEGWEYQVLKGARRLLESSPPRMIIFETDVDEQANVIDNNVVDYLKELKYDVEDTPRELLAGKGTFIARVAEQTSGSG